ncbi:hypothetical protein DVH24_018801 [Malus domestica]|uniref:Uncharacterized protein n=1 Tax=Malus domestica TaxID=3750 RepID=A0A498HJ00_MALDO|nr:hypothetical protein DVH24_018801 [Malus domestica]
MKHKTREVCLYLPFVVERLETTEKSLISHRCFKNNTITVLAKEGELQDRGTTLKLYVQLIGPKALVLPAKDNLMHIKSWFS